MKKYVAVVTALVLLAGAARGGEVRVKKFEFGERIPCFTVAQRSEILSAASELRAQLEASGDIDPTAAQPVLLEWPLRAAAHLTDPGYHGVSGFVDHSPSYPNILLDYNCGTRTYDLQSGYNHQGTDIFNWPFYWNKMDNDDVEIVAAAAGRIYIRQDGNYDRNCGFGAGDWNGVAVLHFDGSLALYGHMKSGSVTSKAVGSVVQAGEYLGVVGSSGSSTGPHLHFEVYNANENLIDPFAGPCNGMNVNSWWASQPLYYDSAINQISTHSEPIGWGAVCPDPDTLYVANGFKPGQTAYFYAFGRDAVMGDVFDISVLRPDSTVLFSDSFTFDLADHWPAIALGWLQDIPVSAQIGTWRYEIYYKGVTYQHFFEVSWAAPIAIAAVGAVADVDRVELTWDIVADEPVAGFEVLRRDAGTSREISVTHGNLLAPDTRRFVDRDVSSGAAYMYSVVAVKPDGTRIRSRQISAVVPVGGIALSPNFPNPFNPSTSIEFTLPRASDVRLSVFDARGGLVAVLEDGPRAHGRHTAHWDGRDSDGRPAASGVYFFRLEAGKNTLTRKSVLLK